jgi:hypothetical protein
MHNVKETLLIISYLDSCLVHIIYIHVVYVSVAISRGCFKYVSVSISRGCFKYVSVSISRGCFKYVSVSISRGCFKYVLLAISRGCFKYVLVAISRGCFKYVLVAISRGCFKYVLVAISRGCFKYVSVATSRVSFKYCILCTFIALNRHYVQILRHTILTVINEVLLVHISWPPLKGSPCHFLLKWGIPVNFRTLKYGVPHRVGNSSIFRVLHMTQPGSEPMRQTLPLSYPPGSGISLDLVHLLPYLYMYAAFEKP